MSEYHLLHVVRMKYAPVSELAVDTQEGPERSEAGCFTWIMHTISVPSTGPARLMLAVVE